MNTITSLGQSIRRAIEDERIIELFAGPGGYSEGLSMLGIERHQALGVEWDKDACTTAEAAGHQRLRADVSILSPRETAEFLGGPDVVTGFHASPPCQGLSMAGKGAGREDLEHLLSAIESIRLNHMTPEQAITRLREIASSDLSALTLEPLRWINDLNPEWVSLEQVPAALPIWEAYASVLLERGFSVWTGNVQAEQYGVPQTRKRAILLASRTHEITAPTPTHSKYHNRTPAKLDEGVQPWVSMAEALGWGVRDLVGFPRKADHQATIEIDGQLYRSRDLREAGKPSFVVTEKARSWLRFTHMGDVYNSHGCIRAIDKPSPTITASMDNGNFKWIDREKVAGTVAERINNQSGTEFDLTWPAWRPAPTVAGREIVTMPGANANRFNGSTKSRNDGVRVSVAEAGVLQSFPADYPWMGTKSSKHQQCGNAVPPRLAAHMAFHVMSVQVAAEAAA